PTGAPLSKCAFPEVILLGGTSNCSASCANVRSPLTAANATFALKAGVWFRRGRLFIVSPVSQATAGPPPGRNSPCRPVQISGASFLLAEAAIRLRARCHRLWQRHRNVSLLAG